jgi:uncharacterized membrane protein
MTDERAALLIAEYANGLRRELALLGASETTDLVSEVVAMLRDASEGDPEVAAAEIEKLGPPEELARTILEQHGLKTGPGTPAPSWWRLGIAAPVDILVGLAAPSAGIAFAIGVFGSLQQGDGEPAIRAVWAGAAIAVLALTSSMAWTYWRPWREGGRSTTVGMALAGISIVRVGGTRTVSLTKDLKAAGLAHAQPNRIGTVLTLVIALAVLAWSVSSIAVALSNATGVDRFAGATAQQEESVRDSVISFYAQPMDPANSDPSWPWAFIDRVGVTEEPFATLMAESLAKVPVLGVIKNTANVSPGVWRVTVEERGKTTRTVVLMLSLRVLWDPVGGTSSSWVISDYRLR